MAKGALAEVDRNTGISTCKKKLSKVAEKIELAEKENTPVVRRSKRRISATTNAKVNLPVVSKTRKRNAIHVKNHATRSKTVSKSTEKHSITVIKEIPNKIQSNSNLSALATDQIVTGSSELSNSNLLISSPLDVSKDSGFESSTRVSDQSLPQLFVHSPVGNKCLIIGNQTCILTCDTVPESYWKELAEQRREALETALHENELIHDQLAVLIAENSQLKQLIKQAEELAEIVKAAI